MKSNANVFDAWFNMMNSMTDTWKNVAEKWTGDGKETANDMSRMTDQWFESYQEAATKMWEPFVKQAQQNSLNYFYLNFFNPGFYKNMMDQSMAIHKTFDQYSSTRYTMAEDFINSSKTFTSVINKFIPSYENLSRIYPHTISGWYTDIFKATQKNMFPLLNSTPDLKSADWQFHLKTLEYVVRYYNKASRMQYLMSSAGLCAWEKLMKEVYSSARDGEPVSFNDLYTLWSELNEKEFENLLHTKDFVMLQEEVLRVKSELIKRFEKQTELLMQSIPVVSKSQMEEVYQTNHDLKKRMTKLEKEMAN